MTEENPIKIFTKMKNDFLSYYNTQFYIENKYISNERSDLINSQNTMWKWPQVELLSNYPTYSNENNAAFSEAGVNKIFHDYLEKSLFSNEKNESFKMYTHQANSLIEASKNKNIILTTGTGSGKTEGMYLPLLNTLLEESLSWTKPNAASEEPWFNSDKKFKEIDNWQRANETREAAVRCFDALSSKRSC